MIINSIKLMTGSQVIDFFSKNSISDYFVRSDNDQFSVRKKGFWGTYFGKCIRWFFSETRQFNKKSFAEAALKVIARIESDSSIEDLNGLRILKPSYSCQFLNIEKIWLDYSKRVLGNDSIKEAHAILHEESKKLRDQINDFKKFLHVSFEAPSVRNYFKNNTSYQKIVSISNLWPKIACDRVFFTQHVSCKNAFNSLEKNKNEITKTLQRFFNESLSQAIKLMERRLKSIQSINGLQIRYFRYDFDKLFELDDILLLKEAIINWEQAFFTLQKLYPVEN